MVSNHNYNVRHALRQWYETEDGNHNMFDYTFFTTLLTGAPGRVHKFAIRRH